MSSGPTLWYLESRFLDACLSRAELTTCSKTPSPVVIRKKTYALRNMTRVRGRRVFVLEDWRNCLPGRRNTKENRLPCKKGKCLAWGTGCPSFRLTGINLEPPYGSGGAAPPCREPQVSGLCSCWKPPAAHLAVKEKQGTGGRGRRMSCSAGQISPLLWKQVSCLLTQYTK